MEQAAATLTAREAAARLDGNEYLNEGTGDLYRAMARSGLVSVFGGSDNQIYFAGAAVEELGARDGHRFHFTRDGYLGKDEAPEGGTGAIGKITAHWCRGGASWSYETAIPHATFTILEDGEAYCIGLVFALADIGGQA